MGEVIGTDRVTFMTQWVKEETRHRSRDEPPRLDSIFTKGTKLFGEVKQECPFGKSDHETESRTE